MRWLWFVASLLCFIVVFRTTSIGLGFLCLLLSFGFMIAGTLSVASSRIASRSRDASAMLGPEEIRKMREHLERKKAAESAGGADAGIVGVSTMTAMMSNDLNHHAESGDAADAGGDGN